MDHSYRLLLMLSDTDLFHDVIVGLPLTWVKFRTDCEGDDHERNQKVTPDTSQDGNHPSDVCLRYEITITDCSHCDDSAPHTVPKVRPIKSRMRHVRQFSRSHCIPEYKDRKSDRYYDDRIRSFLELTLNRKKRA